MEAKSTGANLYQIHPNLTVTITVGSKRKYTFRNQPEYRLISGVFATKVIGVSNGARASAGSPFMPAKIVISYVLSALNPEHKNPCLTDSDNSKWYP